MYIENNVIEDIINRTDIVEIIEENVALKKSGSNFMGLCPFHNEKTPSFVVSQTKQIYHCFGCGVGGNVIKFLIDYNNMTFIEAITYLANKLGIEIKENKIKDNNSKYFSLTRDVGIFYYNSLVNNKEALNYLLNRGLDIEIIQKFGLGFAPKYSSFIEYLTNKGHKIEDMQEIGLIKKNNDKFLPTFFNRIIFPIIDINKHIVGFGGRVLDKSLPKYLNSKENIIFNKSETLYGINIARKSQKSYFILVEGYMDVITMHSYGFDSTIATLGTALTLKHAQILSKYRKDIYLAYDSDNAGIQATLRAISIFREVDKNVKIISLLKYKDPDDFLKSEGTKKFSTQIEQAQNSLDFEIEYLFKNYNLSDPDEKIKFIYEVANKLYIIKDMVKLHTYVEYISQKYNISSNDLLHIIKSKIDKKDFLIINNNENKNKFNNTNNLLELIIQLFIVMINNTEFCNKIKNKLKIEEISIKPYNYIYNCIITDNISDISKNMSLYDDETQRNISKILSEKNDYIDDDMAEYIIKQIRQNYIKNKKNEINTLDEFINLLNIQK